MKNKHPVLKLVFLAVTVAGIGLEMTGASVLVPKPANKLVVTSKGKSYNYVSLSQGKSFTVKAKGPGKLMVFSRLLILKPDTATSPYTIEVKEGKTVVKNYQTSTTASGDKFKDIGVVSGKPRRFIINVARGVHTYEFSSVKTPSVALRLIFHSKRKIKYVCIEPSSYDRPVTAVIREKPITYYLGTKNKNVSLKVIGPSRVKVVSRLTFGTTMTGKQGYKITVTEKDKPVIQKAMSATKSMSVYFKELKGVVAGKSMAFTLKVPKGEHIYNFVLSETVADSVAINLSIPKSKLKNKH